MTTPEHALKLVSELYEQLSGRRQAAQLAIDYYLGKQPLTFTSQEFRDYFQGRYAKFSDNWCSSVAEASTERLATTGIRVDSDGDQKADDDLWRVWRANEADVESGLAFLSGINTSRSFMLVWGNRDDETTPEVTFEDSRQAIVAYAPGSRRQRVAGLKTWCDDTREYATLYLPDTVWKFFRSGPSQAVQQGHLILPAGYPNNSQWLPRREADDLNWPLPNPLGSVPLVELPNRPLLGLEPISDISGVMAMQDAINLLWAELFTTADFAAFPQRILFGAEMPNVPILDADGQVVGKKPLDLKKLRQDRILWIPDPNAKQGEWAAANLSTYTDVIEVALGHISAQTRTPPHYLVTKQGMSNISGDALRASETGLVKKCEEKQLYLGGGLREGHALIALAQGGDANTAKAKAIRSTGVVLWKDAEMRSEAQMVDALAKLDLLGFPFQWLAERYGLTDTEITRVMELKREEKASGLFDDEEAAAAPPDPKTAANQLSKPIPRGI